MSSVKSYKIVLGISGGIAAYKACELVRLFVKNGHEVRIVMTKKASDFVSPLTLATLSGNQVLTELGDKNYDLSATSHIDLAQWGDLFLIAPCTANTMAKIALGLADESLSTEALAFQNSFLVAPAMNTRMWVAEPTQSHYKTLQKRGFHFIGPVSGDLACGEVGLGKMAEPKEIYEAALGILSQEEKPLLGKTVLITSGPTRSYIDSVRFITNRSSGKMGHALAVEAERLGANVILVTGPVEPRYAELAKGKVVQIETGQEMLDSCLSVIDSVDLVFATAAVSDFDAKSVFQGKIKRDGVLSLDLTSSVDVLAELGKRKKQNQIFFGFAAEAGEGEEEFAKAKNKILRKNLDFLALNNISRKDIGFDVNENEVYLFDKNGLVKKIDKQSKQNLANQLIQSIKF
ncbi:MAG: bifunctional phosphopantothenoylcysteine decarboxylase/phosphopantothenate--cysteine ligase CoaBC [Oligoflexia bacterium]|nr:bifunctional phosphopantothenoylcysteine decarboxylase/phosphopantothenate--cysteine ligase CoaBC [Oligoflexia bacterium]